METNDKKENTSKVQNILKISIIACAIITVIVIIFLFYFMYQDSLLIRISIDGITYKITENTQDEKGNEYKDVNGENYRVGKITILNDKNESIDKNIIAINKDEVLYFSIKTIAEIQGYTYTLGEKDEFTTSTDRCHVTCSGEDVSFISESNEIYKYVFKPEGNNTDNQSEIVMEEHENYKLKDKVKLINGELYATAETISKGFNSPINVAGKKIEMYSLKYLKSAYEPIISDAGYSLNTIFRNERAMINEIAIVSKNGANNSNGALYGICETATGNNVTDTRYDSIQYLQNIDKFVVSSNGKCGIIEIKEENGKKVAKEVIEVKYDNISLLDAEKGLFIIKEVNLYGVINNEGKKIVPTEFSSIGIGEVEPYAKQGITNPYLLFDKCIPVQINGIYSLYSLEGDRLIDNLAGYGCSNAETVLSYAGNVLIIPESAGLGFEGIVIKRASGEGKYGVISTNGTMKITAIYDSIYSITRDNKTEYFAQRTGEQARYLKDVINSF